MMGVLKAVWGMLLDVLFFWHRVSRADPLLFKLKLNHLGTEIPQLDDT